MGIRSELMRMGLWVLERGDLPCKEGSILIFFIKFGSYRFDRPAWKICTVCRDFHRKKGWKSGPGLETMTNEIGR